MKFNINEIKLWFNNGFTPRTLNFLPNRVNVITGEKSTGKSSILSIIDYCLLSSKTRIVQKIINDNVAWYGLSFSINEKQFVIVRKAPIGNLISKEVFFSSTGEMPEVPLANISIEKLKSILEVEFSIDENLIVPYGGKKIAAGSKISFRYFLLFNTLSEDTIAHTNVFFDFDLHDSEKYKEALNRIFFLALGVDDASNILIKEKISALEGEIDKLEKKQKLLQKEERLFNERIVELLQKAQEHDLIERTLMLPEEAYQRLSDLITQFRPAAYSNNLKQVEELNRKKRTIWRRIRNLERFDQEYNTYRENLKNDYDSLRPIEYLRSNFDELIPTLEVKTFLSSLEDSLQKVKNEISNKRTLSTNVKSDISALNKELASIERSLSGLPTNTKDFTDEVGKFIFIGELKSQLAFYHDKWNILEELPDRNLLESQIEELQTILKNTDEKRKNILGIMEAVIQKYFDLTHSLGVYQKFKVYFDDSSKILKLREAHEVLSTSNIGSKSNYMFLHLCLFFGLHEHFIIQKQPFVPQFLFLDQPSQPYLERSSMNPITGEISVDDDRETIKDAFSLINKFVDNILKEQKNSFQIILLEHASSQYWGNPLLEHFHLVEEFRNGNALIPEGAIQGGVDTSLMN